MLNEYPKIFRDVAYPETTIFDSAIAQWLIYGVVALVAVALFLIYQKSKKNSKDKK